MYDVYVLTKPTEPEHTTQQIYKQKRVTPTPDHITTTEDKNSI